MATLQGKAVKNTYRQVLQIGANNVGVSGTLQPVQDGAGINTALSLSTTAATINGTLTITGDLIITGGGIQIQDLIDDTVASLIQNGTGITWAYNDTLRTLTPTITIATADGGVQGDFMQLNTGAGEANAVAKIYWNSTEGTADLGLMGGQVILPIGQKQVARVLNNSGSIFNKSAYQVVKITAAQGQRLAVGLAQANNDANSTDTLGLVAENIANNQEGFITTSGLITGVDTTGDLQLEDWNDGDILYLSPTTPGAITKVKPIAPQHTIIVGFVVYAHKTQGKIYVKVDNGYELDELHNVRITSVANNNVLRYNSSLAVWENVAPLTTWITEGTNLYYTQGRFDSAFAAKSTTNLAEGTNLYFTTARGNANFATNLAASTTTNLAEGTNLYFTNQRFDSRFGTKTTTDLAEGTNLYYTQARFNTAFDAKTTTDLDEGTNLYYTDARSRAAISENAVGLDYSNTSGVLSLTSGYAIPTTVKLGDYDTAYNRSIISAAVTGTGTKTLSLTQQDANVVTATWTDQGITTINGTANQIAATTVGNTTTLAFTNDVTMPNNLVVSGNLTINGTATYVNTQAISAKDPLFEVANDNNTTDAVDIGYYGRYFDSAQTRVEFTGLFRDASDAGKFKFFTGLTVEPTNVVDTTGTGYTVGTLVANVEGNLAGTANAANVLSTARSISATGDAAWTVNFDGSANATGALTLANTGVTATTYGTSTSVPTIAVDGKGRITSASNTAINFPVTTVNSLSGNVVLTTSNVAEGTNQYFTTGRVAAYLTGAISTVLTTDLTASRAVASNASGKLVSSATTDTELGYLSGVTSAVQTQLNSKLNLTGGTLTGALSGTSATFNGVLTATDGSQGLNIRAYTGGAGFGAIYSTGVTAGAGNFALAASPTQTILSGVDSVNLAINSAIKLAIASTGAATFSSSITATTGKFNGLGINTDPTSLGTTQSWIRYYNTGGDFYVGLESSTNGGFFTGSTAYDSVLYSNTAQNFIIGGTSRLRIATSGAATFNSTSNQIILQNTDGGTNAEKVGLFMTGGDTFKLISLNDNNTTRVDNILVTNVLNGNVGIGNANPQMPLSVQANTGNAAIRLIGTSNASSNNAGIYWYDSNDSTFNGYLGNFSTSFDIYNQRSTPIAFYTAGTERMRITSVGLLAIGTSGSDWSGTLKALQVNTAVFSGQPGAEAMRLGSNFYFNSTMKYQINGSATMYGQDGGSHYWSTAPSGTAGADITFTERMRITSGGSVGIGTSSPSHKVDVNGITKSSGFVSRNGTISIAAGATQTIYSLPGSTAANGNYFIHVYIQGGSAIYMASGVVTSLAENGQNFLTTFYDGANVTLSVSGNDIRITNDGFGTFSWTYSIIYQMSYV